MTLKKVGTCKSCGYENANCICKNNNQLGTIKNRNTSGETRLYQNYNDMRNTNDYAMTSRINRTSAEERKIMEELLPVDGELLTTYIQRTDIAESKLCEHSIQHHLFGTKRTWSCHTSSRYCFICTLAQYINVNRSLYNSLQEIGVLDNIIINIDNSTDTPTLTLSLS